MSPSAVRFLAPLLPTALLVGSLLACSEPPKALEPPARPAREDTAHQALIPLPPDSQFVPFSCRAAPANDLATDQSGKEERDVVGNTGFPAYSRAASTTHIFFRLRLDTDPRKMGSNDLNSSSYDVLLDTDGNAQTYEYMLTADGNMGGTRVQLVRNSVQEPSNPGDVARDNSAADLLNDFMPAGDYYFVKQTTDGSLFNGTADYFITLAVPRTALVAAGVSLTGKVLTWAGTNSQNYSLNADFACHTGLPRNLADAGADPGVLDPLHTPQAKDDIATTPEDTAKDLAVLANDDGLANTPITVTVLAQPQHGTAVVNVDQTVRYTPAPDYHGPDSFTYQVRDASGQTSWATVAMTVLPVSDGSPAAVDDVASTGEDTAVVTAVLANDTGLLDAPLTVTVLTAPQHGTAVVNGDNTVTYTPAANYHGPDSYTYRVRDGDGQTSSASVALTVWPVSDATPLARDDTASTDEDVAVTTSVLANDTGLTDAPLTVAVVNAPQRGTATVAADGRITYTPEPGYHGTDSYTYSVRDSDGQTSTATVWLTVRAVSDSTPVANADFVETNEDVAVTTTVLGNDTGLLDLPLTVSINSAPQNGTARVGADGRVTYTPAPNFNGVDGYTYELRDGDGQTSTARVTVTVLPVSDATPVAVADADTTREDTAVVSNVLANDTGLADAPLALSLLTAPQHGTVTLNGDNTVTYTPAANYHGPDGYTYQVRDSDGQTSSASVSLTVTPVNDSAPVARPDSDTTNEGTPRTTAVLANDSGLEDAPVTVMLVTPPQHGTATVNGDNTVTYTPEPDYNGSDSYTYRVRDSDGETSTATVSLTVQPVNNGTPVAQEDTVQTDEDTAVTSDVLANDSGLTDGPIRLTLGTQPRHGTLALNADKTVTYTPAAHYHGPDSYTYRVTDADGQSATGTVSLTVRPVNDAPRAESDSASALSNGTGAIVAVLANDSDVDGDVLRIAAVTQGANGTVTINADGTLTYVARADFFGGDTFTYTLDDGQGGTAEAQVRMTVRVANDTDGDGLADATEDAHGLDKNDPDTDDDGVMDGSEPAWRADSDGDGLINALDPDSDNDGLLDGLELGVTVAGPGTDTTRGTFKPDSDPSTTTDPLLKDTDGGGVRDGHEDPRHDGRVDGDDRDPLDPADDQSPSPDTDDDGLADAEEVAHGLDPNDADTDDDGVPDGSEPNWVVDGDGDGLINALDADSDGDGLFDGTERGVTQAGPGTNVAAGHFVPDADPSTTTHPLLRDTDAGGALDGAEDTNHNGRVDPGERDPLVKGDDSTPPDLCAANNGERPDLDLDGVTDACDLDADGDGLIDEAGAAGGGGCAASGGGLSPLVLLVLGALARRRHGATSGCAPPKR